MYDMNAFIWLMVMIAGFAYCTYKFVDGIEPTTPQKTNNVNEGRELLNTRLVKECGVWCAPSDTYYTADKEAFANFAREKAFLEHARNSHKYWRFIKCNGKRYDCRQKEYSPEDNLPILPHSHPPLYLFLHVHL